MKIQNGIVINGDIYGLVEFPGDLFESDECGTCALYDLCCDVSSFYRLYCLIFKDSFHSNFKRFRINYDGEQVIAPLIDYTLNGLILDFVFYELQPTRSHCIASCDLWEVCMGVRVDVSGNLCYMFDVADNARMVFKRTNYDIFDYDVFEEIEER